VSLTLPILSTTEESTPPVERYLASHSYSTIISTIISFNIVSVAFVTGMNWPNGIGRVIVEALGLLAAGAAWLPLLNGNKATTLALLLLQVGGLLLEFIAD
jgi:hypothetical protein